MCAGQLTVACGAGAEAVVEAPKATWVDYALGDADPLYMDRLMQREVSRCMAERGWQYKPLDIPSAERRVDDRGDRERRGFGISIESDDREDVYTASGADPNASYVLGLDEAGRAAYTDALSNSATGCMVKSSKAITERTRAFMMSLPLQLRELIDGYAFDADADIRRAESVWASCMAQGGFQWSTRSAMLDELNAAAKTGGDEVREQERSAAVLDWDCYQQHIEPVRLAKRQEIVEASAGIEPPEWLVDG